MSQRLATAFLALTLGACATQPAELYPRPGSLDSIVRHPQNYDGCVVDVAGHPSGASMSVHGNGMMRLTFKLTSPAGSEFRYEGILPFISANKFYRMLNYAPMHHLQDEAVTILLKGLLKDGKLDIYYIDGPGEKIEIPRATLNSR